MFGNFIFVFKFKKFNILGLGLAMDWFEHSQNWFKPLHL